MSSRSPNAHFLGIELATDQLRASVVDEQLDIVGVACIDFDSDLPEFQCVLSRVFFFSLRFIICLMLILSFIYLV